MGNSCIHMQTRVFAHEPRYSLSLYSERSPQPTKAFLHVFSLHQRAHFCFKAKHEYILLANVTRATYCFVPGISFNHSTNLSGPVSQRQAEDRWATDSNPQKS